MANVCESCGTTINAQSGKVNINGKIVCFSCGGMHNRKAIINGDSLRSSKADTYNLSTTKSDIQESMGKSLKTKKSPPQKAEDVSDKYESAAFKSTRGFVGGIYGIISIIGLILCITGIGAVIGLPLLRFSHMATRTLNGSKEDAIAGILILITIFGVIILLVSIL